MELETELEKIRSMEIRGAGRIARFAAETVSKYAAGCDAVEVNEFKEELMDVFQKLNATRPTAVSLRNALRYIYRNSFNDSQDNEINVNELKAKIKNSCEGFRDRAGGAMRKIGELGSGLVSNGFTIQTHCNSHNALSVIKRAVKNGKKVQVFATESRPWMQGHITVRELAGEGIPVTLIVDSAVRYFMDNVDIVFVGADTVTTKGDLFNKIGTAQVALAANDAGVPFYVCAESFKFSPETLDPDYEVQIEERDIKEVIGEPEKFPGVQIRNPVFDLTPSKHIKGIITELGIIDPAKSKELIEKEFGSSVELEFL